MRSGRARAPKKRAGWGRRTRRRRPGGRPGGRGPHRAASAARNGGHDNREKKKEKPPARGVGYGRGLRGVAGVHARDSRGRLAGCFTMERTPQRYSSPPTFPPTPSHALFKSVRGRLSKQGCCSHRGVQTSHAQGTSRSWHAPAAPWGSLPSQGGIGGVGASSSTAPARGAVGRVPLARGPGWPAAVEVRGRGWLASWLA